MTEGNEIKNRYKGILYVIVASLLWSTGGILIKLIDGNPIGIAGSRSLIAFLIMLIYIKKPKITGSKPQILGASAYALTVICFVIANKMTTSANAILLQFTAPIFVVLLGFFLLKEKIHNYDIISIIAVFLGMTLFFVKDVNPGNMIGNIVAIFSGFLLAGTTVSLRMQKDGSAVETTLLGNLFAFIVSIPFLFQINFDSKSILAIILLGVFQLGISYILYAKSLKYITAIEAILITAIEPLLNPVWVFLFDGENPGMYPVIGGIIVLISVIARNIYIVRKN